jgi:hypothetical protein
MLILARCRDVNVNFSPEVRVSEDQAGRTRGIKCALRRIHVLAHCTVQLRIHSFKFYCRTLLFNTPGPLELHICVRHIKLSFLALASGNWELKAFALSVWLQ